MSKDSGLNALQMSAEQFGPLKDLLGFQTEHSETLRRIASARKHFEELFAPATQLQRQFEEIVSPSVQIPKHFEDLVSPAANFQKQFDQITRPFAQLQKQLGQATSPIAKLQKQLAASNKLYESVGAQFRDSIAAAVKPMNSMPRLYIDQINEVANFVNRNHSEMARALELAENFRKQVQLPESLTRLGVLGQEHASYIERMRLQIADVANHPDLSRIFGDTFIEPIGPESVPADITSDADALDDLSESLGRTRTIGETAEVLLRYAKRPATVVGRVALNLLWLVMLGWFTNQLPTATDLSQKFGLSHREAVKEMRASPPMELSPFQRESLRFVSAPTLAAHISPKQKSKVLALLPFGTRIAVNGRVGDWVYAIYRDPLTDEESEGWLLARYVSKFNRQ
ncbi:SH3 domain-containing protein [Paraburkholderia aspalathi]|uniref:hypothetical protein n=1 Tax=Paraburkholderia aspalathi TaxID=1324617 RepID=UPI0038B6D481